MDQTLPYDLGETSHINMQLPKCVPKYSSVIAERVWEE